MEFLHFRREVSDLTARATPVQGEDGSVQGEKMVTAPLKLRSVSVKMPNLRPRVAKFWAEVGEVGHLQG
jgi:hypothetical protein